MSSMAAAAFPDVAVFHFPSGFADAEFGLADGTQFTVGELAAGFDSAALRKFSTLAVNGRSCLGFAAVRRVQDFIFAVRDDDEVVSAAENGGPYGARGLAEEGGTEMQGVAWLPVMRRRSFWVVMGRGRRRMTWLPMVFPSLSIQTHLPLMKASILKESTRCPSRVCSRSRMTSKVAGLGSVIMAVGSGCHLPRPSRFQCCRPSCWRREFFVVAARLAGCDGCSQRVIPSI